MATMNAAGLALLKASEGLRLTAYQDSTGVWTIGYGHTGDVAPELVITQADADDLLSRDLLVFEQGVENLITRDLTPNQFSALVDFAYNLGLDALAESTLLRLVNAGNFREAAAQFGHWVYAGGVALPGLVTRRAAEAKLFLEPG